LIDTIDTEVEISENILLDEIEEYDSIAILSLMSMYDEIGVKIYPNDFVSLKTIQDLINLAGDSIE
jgi:acyl carrier protein